jgi:proline iminopeptidase
MKILKTIKLITAVVLLLTAISCEHAKKLIPGEGYINVSGGKVWYRIVGEGNGTPILMLHGGPGVPSYYLKPLAALSKTHPVIFYDQMGCGKSDKMTDTSMMTVEHFVDELEQVKQQLGLKDYYLLGQSWGTMLATDYYLKHPEGIKALILSSPAISIPMWLRDADTLITTLPDSIQKAIRTNELTKTYDAPAYKQAVKYYYEHFLARKLPWSPDIDSAFSQIGEKVYTYMGGASEFTMTGPLKDYDRTKRLPEIKVPTLFITGEFDEARVPTVKYYQSLVPGAKFAMITNAGHMTMQDNAEQNIQVINDFLTGIEHN